MPPSLSITDPTEGAVVDSEHYTFRGVTDPGCGVSVGARYDATVQPDGTWSLGLRLEPGENPVTFVATNPLTGLQTSDTVRVYYEPATILQGHLVEMYYHRPQGTQLYYADGTRPSGYYLGQTRWFDLDHDGSGDFVVAFAGHGWYPTERYIEHGFDGLVLILEPKEDTTFIVLDEEPVMITGDRGFLAAACPVADAASHLVSDSSRPRIVTMAFTDTGFVPLDAWRIDLSNPSIEQIDDESLECPDFSAYPTRSDGVGAIETQLGWVPPLEIDDQAFDISTGTLQPMAYYTDGIHLGFEEALLEYRVVIASATPYREDQQRKQRGWLTKVIARDWRGQHLSRVLDATPWTVDLSHSLEWIRSNDGGLCMSEGVLAEITNEPSPILTRAWTISSDLSTFVEVDPTAFTCERLNGGPLIECRC